MIRKNTSIKRGGLIHSIATHHDGTISKEFSDRLCFEQYVLSVATAFIVLIVTDKRVEVPLLPLETFPFHRLGVIFFAFPVHTISDVRREQ